MAPVPRGAGRGELRHERLAHRGDPVGHFLAVLFPLGLERRVREDDGDEPGPVDGRVAVHGADQDLELGLDPLGLLGVGAHRAQGPRPLAVEAEVLGVALAEEHRVALVHEVPHREGVPLRVARGEALVRAVEEDGVPLLEHQRGDLPPLLLRRVHPRRVVGARVEQKCRPLRSRVHVIHHPTEVKTAGLRVVVAVRLDVEPRVLKDWDVVGPGRVGQVECRRPAEAREELPPEPQTPCAGDALHAADTAVRQGLAVLPILELEGELDEVGDAVDASILVVHLGL
mmetsp:Transcript_58382/g.132209  ORF Transcript_58382/g.132209 Transcript_58382/m.132209 type:complete len:285 (-) Transcript_58382:258-1112(-)